MMAFDIQSFLLVPALRDAPRKSRALGNDPTILGLLKRNVKNHDYSSLTIRMLSHKGLYHRGDLLLLRSGEL
jgi:hypothetical protein